MAQATKVPILLLCPVGKAPTEEGLGLLGKAQRSLPAPFGLTTLTRSDGRDQQFLRIDEFTLSFGKRTCQTAQSMVAGIEFIEENGTGEGARFRQTATLKAKLAMDADFVHRRPSIPIASLQSAALPRWR